MCVKLYKRISRIAKQVFLRVKNQKSIRMSDTIRMWTIIRKDIRGKKSLCKNNDVNLTMLNLCLAQ